jgi:single-strand DNA-binding protein
MNSIVVLGNIGKIEEHESQKGQNYTKFSIACNTSQKNETTWFNCTAFGKVGEFISKYFKQGSPIIVTGEIRQTEYEGKRSYRVTVNSAHFVSKKGNGDTKATKSLEDVF